MHTAPAPAASSEAAASSTSRDFMPTSGRLVLMLAHCAGMLDLVALPVWVGTLISRYGLDPQRAGGLATLFLIGAVISSLFFASRFRPSHAKAVAAAGFSISSLAFASVVAWSDYTSMAILHGVAGLATGSALSQVHGSMGRSANPHRLFAMANLVMGLLAVAYMGGVPKIIEAAGGPALFRIFAGVMAVAAMACLLGFPKAPALAPSAQRTESAQRFPKVVWFAIGGIAAMCLVQAMAASFVERIGMDRGFGAEAVTAVLIALGLVNLTPAPIAALLQTRLRDRTVVLAGPAIQAAIVLTATLASTFPVYAVAAATFIFPLIFTHTFAFGLLTRLDPTGRAAAGTPAMLMTGSAIGPILGGTLATNWGYGAIGCVAVAAAILATLSFALCTRPEH